MVYVMVDGFIEEVIEFVAIPLVVVSFFLLMRVVHFVYLNDPDMMRSKIFINYDNFRHALLLLSVMAVLLVFHVTFIFLDSPFVIQFRVQQVLGLFLAVTLTLFAYRLFSVVR